MSAERRNSSVVVESLVNDDQEPLVQVTFTREGVGTVVQLTVAEAKRTGMDFLEVAIAAESDAAVLQTLFHDARGVTEEQAMHVLRGIRRRRNTPIALAVDNKPKCGVPS